MDAFADLDELITDDVDPEFDLAAEFLKQHHDTLTPDHLLDLYGCYKQGTVGDCDAPKPGIFQIQGRAKWNAWNQLRGTTKSMARAQYITKLTSLFPTWKATQSQPGPTVSRLQHEEVTKCESTLADLVKDGSPEEFVAILNALKEEINELDDSGMGLIHWCTDRGNLETLRVLLRHPCIDVNLQDTDGQTALHYASSCGHIECLQVLVEHGADKKLRDSDGNSIEEVAYDENVQKFIQSLY